MKKTLTRQNSILLVIVMATDLHGAVAPDATDDEVYTHDDNGAEDLLFEVYQANHKSLLAYIYGYVYNQQDAQDLLQDVFCLAYEYMQRKHVDTRHLKAWLFRIARNHSLNFKARNKTREKVSSEVESGGQTSSAGFEKEVIDKILVEQILQFIETEFAEKESEAFKLRYFHGLQLDEISKVNEASVSTLSRMLGRCEEKIRQKFGESMTSDRLSELLLIR